MTCLIIMKIHNYTLKSKYENVAQICIKVRKICEQKKLTENFCNSIEISLTEALNNVIEHAYLENENEVIILIIEETTDKIVFKIIDSGNTRKNVTPRALVIDPNDIDSLPESGMGLFIIESIMDKTEYINEGDKNIFKLTKKIHEVDLNGTID